MHFRWPDLGGIVSLKKVVFVSLKLLHFCSEFWLDENKASGNTSYSQTKPVCAWIVMALCGCLGKLVVAFAPKTTKKYARTKDLWCFGGPSDQMVGKCYINVSQHLTVTDIWRIWFLVTDDDSLELKRFWHWETFLIFGEFKAIRSTFEYTGFGVPARQRSVHKSEVVRNFLAQKQWEELDWPAYSPDLSPIENIWTIF